MQRLAGRCLDRFGTSPPGIGSAVVGRLLERVPGHHVALFTEAHADFYRQLGFEGERTGMSLVAGTWLNRT